MKTAREILADAAMESVGLEAPNDSTLFQDWGDSLDVVELVIQVEDELQIELPDDEIERLKTWGEAVAYLEGRLAQ